MININTRGCHLEDSCSKQNENDRKKAIYQGLSYSYFDAKSFLGVKRIRPGELDIASVTEVQNFLDLPVQFYDNSEQMTFNVLGLAPNSKVWGYWESVYHFPLKRINLQIIFKQDKPFMIFDSALNPDEEVLFRVKKEAETYKFAGRINFKDDKDTITNQDINVCIANQLEQTFRITESLFNSIKATLCKNTVECGKVADLNQEPKFSLQLQMNDYKRADAVFNTTFFINSLYKIVDDRIVWKIDKTSSFEDEAGCQFILEQNFLTDKQLTISNDLTDTEFLYIGIKVLEPGDFSKLNFYTFILIVMILLSISLCTVYVILNNSLNKMLAKENMV